MLPLQFLDIIFFTPLTNVHKVEIEDDGVRNADPNYIKEIDNIFNTKDKKHPGFKEFLNSGEYFVE